MDTTTPSHILTTLATSSFIYSFSRTTIRRTNWLGKEDEALEKLERRIQNLEDSKSHQSLQIQDSYSIFQVPQKEEHTDLEKSTESMIQFQSDPFNMIEAKLNRLENMCRNKETFPTQSLIIPNTSNHVDEHQKS